MFLTECLRGRGASEDSDAGPKLSLWGMLFHHTAGWHPTCKHSKHFKKHSKKALKLEQPKKSIVQVYEEFKSDFKKALCRGMRRLRKAI